MTDILVPASLLRDPARFGGTVAGDMRRGHPVVRDGRLVALDAPTGSATRIVLPQLVEAHCHLDQCHTQPRLGPTGGDLPPALPLPPADKVHWTEAALPARATPGLRQPRPPRRPPPAPLLPPPTTRRIPPCPAINRLYVSAIGLVFRVFGHNFGLLSALPPIHAMCGINDMKTQKYPFIP